MRVALLAILMCISQLALCQPMPRPARAALVEIDGAIGPATSLYYSYAVHEAQARGASLIILRVDTPGGLDGPMRDIIKQMLSSRLPVVAFVAPSGARAASAGTYLLYASHVAAMAPATNLGAATPIPVMGEEQAPPGRDDSPRRERDADRAGGGNGAAETGTANAPAPSGNNGEQRAPGRDAQSQPRQPVGSAASRKAVNDATAYLRSLAERRGRNADWAEQAVREGASLSADAALRLKVIDLVATDTTDLLRQLDGRRIPWGGGERVLRTGSMIVDPIAPTWRQSFLGVITSPTVAYLLMLIGIYGLLLEGYSPGAILPGVAGGICLLLALYAFQLLPVNYAGLALLALGIALIVAETLVPSVGILGIGGVIAFVAGSILLLDSDVPGYRIPLGLVAGAAATAGLLMLLSMSLLLRTTRRTPVQVLAGLAHDSAEALEDFSDEGWIEVRGERWRASSAVPIRRGQRLRIVSVQGLQLAVEPVAPLPDSAAAKREKA
ncbi:MAG: serine protease [Moraxellaceae bacterium]|jgi:membrane-bound serine protease (ClpP class)|nr:serine protease [Moraxellaceae bacterium]